MKRKIYYLLITAILTGVSLSSSAQSDTTVYHLTIRKEKVDKAGKKVMGMTINGSIPGPTLRFREGDYAIIYVKNEMDVETSIHWHGLLVPNFYDGVPYLTTPPIEPGETQKYEFHLKQSGTYWYHSHTMLQEQRGVYGSIVIEPREKKLDFDKELVLVLSDWTNEKPMNVLRTLKRGSEWYQIKKGTATPLNRVIAEGGLGAQLKFWKQRMDGVDIADVYYPAFLINGKQIQEYPDFKPGERVRLRIIDGSTSTSFWMTFGGGNPTLVSADGNNVVPVKRNKTFIAIAETYDFIVTIPTNGKIEFKATAADGSGSASAYLGQGKILAAPDVPKPDKIAMMKKMAKMDMRMGAPALKFRPKKNDPQKMKEKWGMQGNGKMKAQNPPDAINYDFLRSRVKTNYPKNAPVKKILLNLTGNMKRYIWSMNGIPLSESSEIRIKKGEIVRITLNNLTMMDHPMHLHGHFFRVLNKNGKYSPLKHTVNVPAMKQVTIELYGSETGDWFFHCHVLYHLMSGMARIFSYDTPRDPRLKGYPLKKLVHETNRYYTWGRVDIASHETTLSLVSSNIRNQFNFDTEYGWNKNMETEFTYERYLYDYFRVFVGVNVENTIPNSLNKIKTTAVAGIRWFTPYMFDLDLRIDNELRPRISISRDLMAFPRLFAFGYYEYRMDFGWVNKLPANTSFEKDVVWNAGLEYMLSKNISLMASYDNRFGGGGGFTIRF